MKYKSQVYSQASGSIAGTTHSHNQGGLYTRARSIPVNSNTAAQQKIRNAMATLTSRWQSVVTPAQRAAWATYASNVPLINSLGDARPIGALSMYVRCNSPRVYLDGAGLIIDDGPTTMSLGTFTPISATCAAGALSVTFDNTDDWATGDGGFLLLYGSKQLSPTINFFKGPFKIIDAITGSTMTPPTSPHADTITPAPAAGNVIYLRCNASGPDGRLSSSQIVRIVCT